MIATFKIQVLSIDPKQNIDSSSESNGIDSPRSKNHLPIIKTKGKQHGAASQIYQPIPRLPSEHYRQHSDPKLYSKHHQQDIIEESARQSHSKKTNHPKQSQQQLNELQREQQCYQRLPTPAPHTFHNQHQGNQVR